MPLAAILVLAAAFALRLAFYHELYYEKHVPLGLWGAERVRLDPDQVRVYREAVESIQSSCDQFITIYGFNSLYFWAQKEPPTYFSPTIWPQLLNRARQDKIKGALEASPRPCVLDDTRRKFRQNRREIDPVGVLGDYIFGDFVAVRRIGWYDFYVRR